MPNKSASHGDNVVSIHGGRRFRAAADSHDAPHTDLDQFSHSEEPDDFWHRMRMNAIAFGFVAVLIVAGLWLANSLATMRKDQDCVLSGKRGCSPVETAR